MLLVLCKTAILVVLGPRSTVSQDSFFFLDINSIVLKLADLPKFAFFPLPVCHITNRTVKISL